MTHAQPSRSHPWLRATGGVLGHAAAVVVGFGMMVLGLGLGVTMIMLPVGIVVGFAGVALFIGGLFTHLSQTR